MSAYLVWMFSILMTPVITQSVDSQNILIDCNNFLKYFNKNLKTLKTPKLSENVRKEIAIRSASRILFKEIDR